MKPRNLSITVALIGLSLSTSLLLLATLTLPAFARIDMGQVGGTTELPVLDDFEDGIPAGFVGFADAWDGSGSTTTLAVDTAIEGLPTVPAVETNTVVSVTYDIAASIPNWGGAPGYGGVTRDFDAAQDWTGYEGFSFWFYGGSSGADHRVELKSDGDDSFNSNRYEYTFTDDFTGWRLFDLPFDNFSARTDFNPGPSPGDSLNQEAMWGYSILLAPGSSGTFYLDHVVLTKSTTIHDFESGLPEGFVGFADSWDGSGSTTTLELMTTMVDLPVVPAVADSTAVSVTYFIDPMIPWGFPGYGGVTFDYASSQDWSAYNSISFWFYGTGTGGDMRIELKSDGDSPAVSNRYEYTFADVEGWQFVNVPFASFVRRTDFNPGPSPDDPINLEAIWGYSILLVPNTGGTFKLDNVALHGRPDVELKVAFDNSDYAVREGAIATATIKLNMASSDEVTVAYMTADSTATAGTDYVEATGTLVFPPEATEQTFTIETIDNDVDEDDRTILLTLFDPVGAILGTRSQATVTILDNDETQPSGKSEVFDDFEQADLPSGEDANGTPVGYVTWNHPNASVAISLTQSPPAPVPDLGDENTVLQLDMAVGSGQWAGYTHAFTNETADEWLSQDWSLFEGISLWLFGRNTGGTLFVDILDNRNEGSTGDDAERWSYDIPDNFEGWQFIQIPFDEFSRKEIGNGAPNDGFTKTEIWGYAIGGFGSVDMGANTYYVDDMTIYGNTGGGPQAREATFGESGYEVAEGDVASITVSLTVTSEDTISVTYATAEASATPDRDFVPASGTLVFAPGEAEQSFEVETLDDTKREGEEKVILVLTNAEGADLGFGRRTILNLQDNDEADPDLVDDFEGFHPFQATEDVALQLMELPATSDMALPEQGPYETVVSVDYDTGADGAGFSRTFVEAQDWSAYEGISLWYYGSNSGQTMTVELQDNQSATTADVEPEEWVLVWSDEFDDPAGTRPNPNHWKHEIGDGTLNGIPGWGNGEFEYYTDGPENAATDGDGNLVISVREAGADSELLCWYGPCEYTSARLISSRRTEFQYGRIEARIKVPPGEDGLWPAFWMLGTDIDEVGWPQTGEIDIMEYVSRIPTEIFGTIHGPGYSGGASFGSTYEFPEGVAQDYHTFAIEWAPNAIHWYVDGINYHNAEPSDVAPNEWVYNHPFFVLLNVAIGGNFGGAISDELTFPQDTLVDYVRVYQAPSTAERFEATFVDNFAGWQRVTIPFASLIRSANQPDGAPDDGLGLSEVWGYGFRLPGDSSGSFHLDRVRTEATVEVPEPRPGTDSLTARVFIDYRCDGFFQNGLDVPLADVAVTLSFPNGASVTRQTKPFGLVNFSGFDASGGIAVTAALPRGFGGYSLSSCRDSPGSITLKPTDFQWRYRFVQFGVQVTGEAAGP